MKRFMLFGLMMVLAGVLHAQDTTLAGILPVDESGMIKYQGVVEVKGLDKGALYNKGIEWINQFYPNPSSVTKKRIPESGIIEGTHSIRITDDHNGTQVPSKTINYTFKLEFREGRFRYTITDFTLKAASRFPLERWLDRNGPWYDLNNRPYLLQVQKYMNDLIDNMTTFMTKPEKPAEEEW